MYVYIYIYEYVCIHVLKYLIIHTTMVPSPKFTKTRQYLENGQF